MNGAGRERVKELLSRAAKLAPAERRGFIEASAGDPGVAAEAVELLSALDESDFLKAPTGGGVARSMDVSAPVVEGPGSRIGRYKLLQRIGEGGFGTVFMAEQTEPVIRRVALKIIKAGMDTRQVIARFEAERQALAMMDHPNIARVLDGGQTDGGRPYFVMELVKGEPVTRYCDRQSLSVRERLMLFCDICGAVQHAHQKGVIHRDIKPSNVLVTMADGVPLPKVIDFGIAKATAVRLTDKTLFTEMHQLIGTPEYMSPEQAEVSGVDIDTRSDVYSLGVLLYELLAGGTPFDAGRLRKAPFAEMQRIIRDEEPPRPSMRLRTIASSQISVLPSAPEGSPSKDRPVEDIAKRRRTEPISLARSLRGDLDWIVMKCLEKDRSRRYGTASALADDVGNYLAQRPVSATPPSPAYRVRKFVRRNRGAVLAIAAMAATLLLATAVSLGFAFRAWRALAAEELQRKRADKSAQETQKVAEFQQAQLSGIDPEAMGRQLREDFMADAKAGMERAGLPAGEVEARQKHLAELLSNVNPTNVAMRALEENIFDRALTAAREQFKDEPVIRARLLQTLSATLGDLGMWAAAADPQREALEIRRTVLGDTHPDTIASIGQMGELLERQTKYAESEAYCREALQLCQRSQASDSRDTLIALNNLGLVLLLEGKREEAGQYLEEMLKRARAKWGDENEDTLQVLDNLGGLAIESGKLVEAEKRFEEAYAARRRLQGDSHRDTLLSASNLALAREKLGHVKEAGVLYRQAFDASRSALGEDHPQTLLFMSNLGFLLGSLGQFSEAESLTRGALQRRKRLLGDEHWDTLQSMHNLGVVLAEQGRNEEAEVNFRQALEGRKKLLGDEHSGAMQTMAALGELLLTRGEIAEAEQLDRVTLTARRRTLGDGHPDTVESMLHLGELMAATDRTTEAEEIFREAVERSAEKLPADHPIRIEAQIWLGRTLTARGQFNEAETTLAAAEGSVGTVVSLNRPRGMLLEAQVELVRTKCAAEPGDDCSESLAERQAALASWRATTQPTE